MYPCLLIQFMSCRSNTTLSDLLLRNGNLVVVSLGSNLATAHGSPRSTLDAALSCLQDFSVEKIHCSSLWETAPEDCPEGSPPFVNAIAIFKPRGDETPLSLLQKLQALEIKFGRSRVTMQNAPRTLDLDLICFGDTRLQTPALTLPHPRAHLRSFVLRPLAELAPGLHIPGQALSVAELLAGLPAGHDCILSTSGLNHVD